ncbi:hypothetical protein HPB52_001504 [Rhipicephalus sanguineus]|uniref:HTH psq-type domain-containing protein n=1 Tax=Rhipicephalus sanguineus TaxID=34632 RepID=A0A9D4STI4_RHISA|nr:hypothetical protein HPB52_001504 [Rhipicephalus sanguineus]
MDEGSGKRKRKTISVEQKAAIVKAVESGTKKSRIAQDFGIAVSTLSTILTSLVTCDSTSAESDGTVVDENTIEASWKALGDTGVVATDDSSYDYVNADADAVTTEEPNDDAIVADVTGRTDASDDEDAVVSYAHTFDVPTSSQALDAVDLLRSFFGAHDNGENGMNAMATAEREIHRLRYPKQRSITDFFTARSSGQ